MKSLIVSILLCCLVVGMSAQRYQDVIFSSATVTRDIQYGSAPDYQGTPTNLVLDVYQPDNDMSDARALVVLVHGGGFTGGGKAGENFQEWGTDLARHGYVVASIEYRLGVTSKTDAAAMWGAALRCGQDTRAAVRYLRSKRNDFRIDTSHIFLLGTSAGGFGILQASILQDDEIPDNVDPAIGNAEGNSGTPNESSRVHGLVVCWGATTDTTFIEAGDPPIYAVHGTADKTVPYQCGPSKFGFDLCGGEALTKRAQNLGIATELLLFPGAGHTLDGDPVLLDSCYRFAVRCLATLADKTTDVDELESPTVNVVAYPNPLPYGSNLYVEAKDFTNPTIEVRDLLGSPVTCTVQYVSPTLLQISMSGLPPAVLYVTVSQAGTMQVVPVMVVK